MTKASFFIIGCLLVSLISFPVIGKDVTQADINIILEKNLTEVEKDLNLSLQELTEKVSEEGKEKLQKAHQSFLSYRQAECDFETAGTEGGSVHSTILGECLSFLTKQQTKLYKEQLNCEEGNLSCGGQ